MCGGSSVEWQERIARTIAVDAAKTGLKPDQAGSAFRGESPLKTYEAESRSEKEIYKYNYI